MQKILKGLALVLSLNFQHRSHWSRIIVPILLWIFSLDGSAQDGKLFFKKYGVPEGLPEGNIQDILQDDQGFIWFGTQAGLVKYDGYEFQVFKGKLDKTDTSGAYLSSCNGGVIKSRDGKIWIGTEDGVITSYDPAMEKFTNYYPISQKGGSVYVLFDDPRGNVWFKAFEPNSNNFYFGWLHPGSGKISFYPNIADGNGSRYGSYSYGEDHEKTDYGLWMLDKRKNLCFLDTLSDRFEVILPVGQPLTAAGLLDTIRFIYRGLGSSLLLTSDIGFYVFDMQQRCTSVAYLNTEKSNSRLFAKWPMFTIQDRRGNYWVSHWGGMLSKVDHASGQVVTYRYGDGMLTYDQGPSQLNYFLPLYSDTSGIWFQSVTQDRNNTFWLHYDLTSDEFCFYDRQFNSRDNPPLPANVHYPNLKDRTGLWWIGAKPGLFKQAPINRQMDLFRFDYEDPNSLPDDDIKALFEDSKNRLWIGTTKGAAIYSPKEHNFMRIQHNPTDPGSVSSDLITTIYEDSKGGVWIGTDNGLNLWQENSKNFKRFYGVSDGFNPCHFIYTDKSGRLWVVMNNEGLLELTPGMGKMLKKLEPVWNPRRGNLDLVTAIFQDSRKKLWVGTRWDGLFCLDEEESGFIPYLNVPGDTNSISSNQIRKITEDSKGRLWIGTNLGGLNQRIPAENRFISMSSEVRLGSIQAYAYDQKGSLWLGTYSGVGLTNLDGPTGEFVHYGNERGLLHNDIVLLGPNQSLAVDQTGKFYIPTQRGLSIFDPETRAFSSFYEKDGFQPYSLGYHELRRRNGEIWIGGKLGLNRIVPDNLFGRDSTMGDLVLTKMTINDSLYTQPDGAIFKKAVSYTNAIRLKHWQKDITFEYVYLHYLRSEDNLYSWKLEHYNDTWSAPSNSRKASLTNLSPGTYIFKVKAANADGIWKSEPTTISITILPPWWRTWWAYAIYTLLLLALGRRIYFYQQARALRQERQKAQERELQQAKEIEKAYTELKATQAQLIQSEKMASLGELTAGIAHEIQNPLNFVNNFSELSNELIDEMKEELASGDREEALAIADDIKGNLEKINHHGKRADAIVKGMLLHSRASTGQKEPTDINALCDEYLRLAYHGLRAKDKSFNADIKTDFDPDLPLVHVVQQDISRVLLNLINNAFCACAERSRSTINEKMVPTHLNNYKPCVSISTKLSPLKGTKGVDAVAVEISIKDNGNGIPDSIKDKIFQPFFTTKPTGQGTGLGLSLSYDIIKAHDGVLSVVSKEGESTEFCIHLPL